MKTLDVTNPIHRSLLRRGFFLIAVALVALAAPRVARANAVTDWNQVAVSTLVAFPAPAGGAPTALQINMAMTQGAVYDAVNAIERKHQPYLLATRYPNGSKQAAVATAAYAVLSNIVSTVPASITFPNQQNLLDSLYTQYKTYLNTIPDGPAKTAGINAGNAAANAMITARQNDGRFGPSPWTMATGIGYWDPLLPNGTSPLDPTPWVANVRPFLIQSSSQFRTDGPNALTSTAYAEDFKEVKALGSANSTVRTSDQTHIAIFWQSAGGPAFLWNGVARNLVAQYGSNVRDSALLFAMMNLSAADAAINCWNDKYYWDFWRPWTAIHQADQDGNPDTEADPSWAPLLTAPYPEHPSGHMAGDGAHLEVLQTFFGTDKIAFDVTSTQFGGETRHYERFSNALKEITSARVWAGLHFRTADVQSRILGRKIADYMAKHYFQPLD
jgi:hypothetical protein